MICKMQKCCLAEHCWNEQYGFLDDSVLLQNLDMKLCKLSMPCAHWKRLPVVFRLEAVDFSNSLSPS